MRWLRMISLYFERTLEYRLRSFLWIVIPMFNNLTLILFWNGAREKMDYITSYYILMTIGGLFLTSHVEYYVSEIDIKQGGLVNYLLKPISYYWINLLDELPYRVLQAAYAGIFLGAFIFLFHGTLSLKVRPEHIPLVFVVYTLGYLISFTFKLCTAYLSFWFTDIRGLHELMAILAIVFSGGVMPLEWYPPIMRSLAQFLPFAYSGYYPIMTVIKPLQLFDFLSILSIQGIWLCGLLLVHRFLWREGVKEFTAVGQ